MHLDPADALRGMARGGRIVVGFAGPPGAGKSTLAADAVARLGEGPRPLEAVAVPMDGFHVSAAELASRGLSDVKGAPETFDVAAYAGLLAAIRSYPRTDVRAPAYDRTLHEPVPDRITVTASCTVVVTEGNYVCLPRPEWEEVRAALDAVWYLDVPWEVVRSRLIARHVLGGRAPAEAAAWVDRVDAPNARLVAAAKDRADAVLVPYGDGWTFA